MDEVSQDTAAADDDASKLLPNSGEGRRFERHVFVCVSGKTCPRDTACETVAANLKALVKTEGLRDVVRVNKAGCLGQCGHGPVMVVYPEGAWYGHLSEADARRVWDEHIVGGRVVEDLQFRTASPGNNVVPRRGDGSIMREHPAYDPCNRCVPEA